jgi:hypothetical protein
MIGNRMAITAKAPRQEMMEFIGQHIDTHTKLELLLFWGKHPNTKFTLRTLRHALNENKVGVVERNLEDLAQSGVVNKHIHPRGGVFFGLAAVREIQGLVLELSKCSRHELNYCWNRADMGAWRPLENS